MDGRLHVHICVYGSKWTPELITRVSCSPDLSAEVGLFLDSVCCTKFDQSVHEMEANCMENG